jgi:hypothetical protein
MNILICASMKFVKEMVYFKEQLENKGHKVILPPNIESYLNGTIDIENKLEKIKLNIFKL